MEYIRSQPSISDCVIVSVSFSAKDEGVLVVGRQNSETGMHIINALSGPEAYELYQKIITKKEK